MGTNRQTLLVAGDSVMLAASFVVMVALRFNLHTQQQIIATQARIFALLFLVWIIVFFICDLYDLRRVNPNPRNIGRMIVAMTVNVSIAIFFFYLFPHNVTPKTNLAIIALIAFALMVAWRRFFYVLFTRTISRNIGIIGTHSLFTELEKELARHPQFGTVVIRQDATSTIDSTTTLDMVITNDLSAKACLALARQFDADLFSLTHAYRSLFAKVPLELMNDEIAFDILSRERNHGRFVLSRIVESILAALVLIITSPILLVAALAIVLEDGRPVLYSQPRVGKNGAVFSIYKLRSMRPDAETNGAKWADQRDSRVTRVGRVLRKLHIDEIPQLWNVIRGDLALVGPRPERPAFVAALEQEIPYYFLRHTIRPGFTGWAQIKYRYARTVLDSKEKFEYDLYYLWNRNTLLDIGIILKTIQIIFTHF